MSAHEAWTVSVVVRFSSLFVSQVYFSRCGFTGVGEAQEASQPIACENTPRRSVLADLAAARGGGRARPNPRNDQSRASR